MAGHGRQRGSARQRAMEQAYGGRRRMELWTAVAGVKHEHSFTIFEPFSTYSGALKERWRRDFSKAFLSKHREASTNTLLKEKANWPLSDCWIAKVSSLQPLDMVDLFPPQKLIHRFPKNKLHESQNVCFLGTLATQLYCYLLLHVCL